MFDGGGRGGSHRPPSRVPALVGALPSGPVRLVLLLVALVVAAGCTTVVEGTPSAPTGVLLPPRPREVRLDGVDPCSLLTAEQRVELGLDGDPRSSTSSSQLYRGEVALCTVLGFQPDAVAVGIGLVKTVGIQIWTTGELQAQVKTRTVAGFPAVTAVPTRFAEYCSVDVDIAEGQLLDVQVRDGGRQPPLSQQQLCDHAGEVATAAVTSLLKR